MRPVERDENIDRDDRSMTNFLISTLHIHSFMISLRETFMLLHNNYSWVSRWSVEMIAESSLPANYFSRVCTRENWRTHDALPNSAPSNCIPTRYSRGWAYAWHNALAIIEIIKENDSVLKFRWRRPISVSHLTRRTSRKCIRSIYIDFYFVYFYFLYFTLYFYAITRLCVRVLLLLLLSWYFSSSKSAFSFITCLYITTCAICF